MSETKTKSYVVTDKAGPYVCGRKNPGIGKTLELSAEQANYPLLNGEIEPKVATKAKSESKK